MIFCLEEAQYSSRGCVDGKLELEADTKAGN